MPLQDTDNLIIGRGTDSYKITYQDLKDDLNYVPPPTGTINKPVVLSPEDGAGSGTTRDIETDTITKVENDGANKKLTLASNKDLADLNIGDVVKMGADADVPYQPVSDSIVSVVSQAVISFDAWGNNMTIEVTDPFITDVSTFTSRGTNLPVGSDVSPNGTDTARIYKSSNPVGAVGFKIGLSGYSGATRDHYFYSSPTGTPGSWTFIGNPTRDDVGQGIQINDVYGMMLIKGGNLISNAGYTVISSESLSVLTLSGDTDLKYFRVGDVVQSDWNQDEVWSNNLQSSSGWLYPPTAAFDGNIGPPYTYAQVSVVGSSITFTPSTPIPYSESISIYMASADGTASVNGGSAVAVANSADSVIASGSGTLTSLVLNASNSTTLMYIKVDGKLLVDQGIADGAGVKIVSIDDTVPSITVDGGDWYADPANGGDGSTSYSDNADNPIWNQSQEWSATTVNDPPSFPAANAFDADDSTYYYNPTTSEPSRVTFSTPLDFTKVEILGASSSAEVCVIVDSGGAGGTARDVIPTGLPQTGGSISGRIDITSQLVSPIRGIGVNGRGGFRALIVDGKRLVDGSINSGGAPIVDAEVTCLSPLKAPTDWTIEDIDTTANTISLSHAAEDNSQVWVANDNQADIDFFVTGPKFVDNPLLTADVSLRTSDFATTPFQADTLRNIVWELNGQEQNAGTMNPFKPTVSTNTTYTVRAKHQGNALEDSEWSDSVTFTTGATRNLYEYHIAALESVRANFEARVAALEADHMTLMNNNNNNYGY